MRKITVLSLMLAFATAMLGMGIITPLMSVIGKQLNAGGMALALIFGGFSLAQLITLPLVGKIADRFCPKNFIIAGILLIAAVSVCYPLAKSVFFFVAVRIIHGVAAGMIIPPVMAYAGSFAKKGKEGSSIGLMTMAQFIGVGSAPLLSGFLHDLYGFSTPFYTVAAIAVGVGILALAVIPNKLVVTERSEDIAEESAVIPFKELITFNAVRVLLIYSVAITWGTVLISSFLSLLAAPAGISSAKVGFIVAFSIILTGILQLPFGALVDRMGKEGKLIAVAACSFITVIGLFFMPLGKSFIWFFIFTAVIGIGRATSLSACMCISVIIGRRIGMAYWTGLLNTAMNLSGIMAPLAAGAIMDLWNVSTAFYAAGVISFSGIIWSLHFVIRRVKYNMHKG